MSNFLVAINDSNDIECAFKHVMERHRTQPGTLFLLNVQTPISKFITRFVSRKQVEEFHQENGMQILQPMIDRLDTAGVPHQECIVVGHKAESIVRFAREHQCSQIVVPKHKGMFENIGLGSVGSQLRQLIGAEGSCDISEVY